MKRYLLTGCCALIMMSLVSCINAPSHPDVDTSLTTFTPTSAAVSDSATDRPVIATPLALPVTEPLAFNPPHGQPGHDCAIAVGAPLKAASAPTTAPAVPAAPVVNTVPAPLPVNNSSAKINPPHGQPGHDCSVAVGQPLTATATPAAQVTPATPILNSTPAPLPVSAGTGRINPPHGQPGHDCAIAVGQPIP